jgi:hypothetical protein
MSLRKLNSFAGGASQGIGAGAQIAQRAQALTLAGNQDVRAGNEDKRADERQGFLRNADARAGTQAGQMEAWIQKFSPGLFDAVFGNKGAPAANTGATTFTTSQPAAPEAQALPFGEQATQVPQTQPTQPTTIQKWLMENRRMPGA